MKTAKQNNPDSTVLPTSTKRPLWPKLLTVVVLLGVAAIFISQLPRGFSQDFSQIGKGERIVVMVHNPRLVDSGNNMDLISRTMRDEYKGRVTFLVADLLILQGTDFTKAYDIENSTALVFFAPNGEKIKVVYGPQSAESLRKLLDDVFHL